MTQILPSITIGIPAFNEEGNIVALINDLLNQEQNSFKLDQIIVNSDGSNDQTVALVKALANPVVTLLDNQDRQGQAFRQNQILSLVKSDILVLINADVVIDQVNFLAEIIKPIQEQQADLVSTSISTTSGNSFFTQTLNYSLVMKNWAFESYKAGQNLFTCHGATRAFSHRLYQKFSFGSSVGEDAYSYLFCQKYGFKYVFTPKALVKIQSPATLKDHQNQSVRFFQTQVKLKEAFTDSDLKKAYFLPMRFLLTAFLRFMLLHPLHAGYYLGIVTLMKIKSFLIDRSQNTWQVSNTSKVIQRSTT